MTSHTEDTPLSKDAFEKCGWKAALDSARNDEYSFMAHALSTAARQAEESGKPAESQVLKLLGAMCSMILRTDSINEPFGPFMVMNGRRTTTPDDLHVDEVEFLSSVYPNIDNARLRARLADVVFLVQRPRDPAAAIAAIDAYRQIPITQEGWGLDGRECWDRAIRLCLMLRAGADNRLEEIEQALGNALLASSEDEGYMPLWIAELLLKHGLGKSKEGQICSHLGACRRA